MAEKAGKKIAIEIETGKSDAIYNIRKDLEEGIDRVICVFLTEKAKKYIFSQLKEAGLDKDKRIELLDIDEFSD